MCVPPLAVIENNESDIKWEGVCAASLPTTMAISSSLLAQTTLKLLLGFGKINLY